jgi:hypothetical protein
MLAIDGDEPVGVLLGAKNAEGNFVYRIAVHPDHRRRGHGRHLIESLRNKVAILGPPRLTVEIAADREDTRRFVERSGFSADARYFDWIAGDVAIPESGLAAPITIDELAATGALAPDAPLAWEHSADVLRRRRRDLEGLVIASDERIEAHVVYRRSSPSTTLEVVSLRFTRLEALRALLGDLAALRRGPLRVLRSAYGAADADALARVGFTTERETIGYRADL